MPRFPHSPSARSRRAFLALGVTATTALAGCNAASVEARERTTDTVDVADATELVVTGRNGSVTVEARDRDTVELTATKRSLVGRDAFDDATVRTEVADGTLSVGVDYATDRARRVAVDLDIRVPASLSVSSVETQNGSVEATGTRGDATITSQNGTVTATDVDGFVTLTTNNGTVESSGCRGVDGVRTANGTVDVEVLDIRQDVDVSTANGSVEVAVPPSLDAEVELTAGNGTVDVDGLELANLERTSRRITGRLGDGGNRLRLSVSNGSADLVALDG
ncbi:Putative adhesin [Halogranum amylolyticum]|uniref:Putative adhesin n=1 Tax=Halogranum amylolyticum TaxID=660520 RepID=A0A1H8P340_9EURY|nr:DUF4097 family beta strand repeat-containing protein [Halogranum amylolyticum]SEO35963.1 Putative adhesin [Halogranum amylolyticum]